MLNFECYFNRTTNPGNVVIFVTFKLIWECKCEEIKYLFWVVFICVICADHTFCLGEQELCVFARYFVAISVSSALIKCCCGKRVLYVMCVCWPDCKVSRCVAMVGHKRVLVKAQI